MSNKSKGPRRRPNYHRPLKAVPHPASEKFPDRAPDPEAVAEMDEILLEMDELTAEKGFHIAIQSVPVDVVTLGMTAQQRANEAQEQLTNIGDEKDPKNAERERLIIMWLDAFITGYHMAARRAPQIEQLMDEALDGNRRAGPLGNT